MIKIIDLSFEESARLERILNTHGILYKWDFSADWLGCIDKLYDIELPAENCTIEFKFGVLVIKVYREIKEVEIAQPSIEHVDTIVIKRDAFKEVIIS